MLHGADEKAKFVCFIYMQHQKGKLRSVQIHMKLVSWCSPGPDGSATVRLDEMKIIKDFLHSENYLEVTKNILIAGYCRLTFVF